MGLGTDWAQAWAGTTRAGWAQADCVQTSRVPINSLGQSVSDKAWEGAGWARTRHKHEHGLGTGTDIDWARIGHGHGLGTDWARAQT